MVETSAVRELKVARPSAMDNSAICACWPQASTRLWVSIATSADHQSKEGKVFTAAARQMQARAAAFASTQFPENSMVDIVDKLED